MITVILEKKSQGSYAGFTCSGHAGYADKGSDIICAAVSVLIINTINSMEELAGEKLTVSSDETEGFIECRLREPVSDEGILLLDAMALGLKGIAKQYGRKYLTVKCKEV